MLLPVCEKRELRRIPAALLCSLPYTSSAHPCGTRQCHAMPFLLTRCEVWELEIPCDHPSESLTSSWQAVTCSTSRQWHGPADLHQSELQTSPHVPSRSPTSAVLCLRHLKWLHGCKCHRACDLRPLPYHTHGERSKSLPCMYYKWLAPGLQYCHAPSPT